MRNSNSTVIGVAALAGLALAAAVRPSGTGGPKKALAAARRRPQQAQAAMQVFTPNANHPSVPQTLAGGLWRADGGFQAVMMLRNELDNMPLPVTPVLYMADGTELDLAPVTLGPAGVAMVDINTALASAPSTYLGHISTYGSAAVRSSWPWQAVVAAARSTDDIRGLIYQMHMESDVSLVDHPKASITRQLIESDWWKEEPNVSGFMSLANVSGTAITAAVAIGDHTGTNIVSRQYQLAPHATAWIDFAPFWAQLPAGDAGSIEISYTGPMYALSANGGMEDASNGYSHMLRFDVPEALQLRERLAALPPHLPASVPVPDLHWSANTTIDAAGIMVGSQDADMQFPAGAIFKPYLVLRNTTASTMPVRLSANAMTGGAPQDVPIGALQLGPLETRRVNLSGLLASSSLAGLNGYINLEASYAGSPTDLGEISGSVDQTYNYVFEVPPRIELPSSPALINYWNANGETDTMITLHNFGSAPQDVVLTLAHQAGKYEMPVHLAPHASMGLILGKLIAEGVPDRNGNVIPANIVQGSAKIMPASGNYHDRHTVSVQFAVFNPRTGTCGYSCSGCDAAECAMFSPDEDTLAVGSYTYMYLYVVFSDNCCCKWELDPGSSWTNDSSIATFDDNRTLTATGAGTTYVGGTATAPSGGGCTIGDECAFWAALPVSGEAQVTPTITCGNSQDSCSPIDIWWFNGLVPSNYTNTEAFSITAGNNVPITWTATTTNAPAEITGSGGSTATYTVTSAGYTATNQQGKTCVDVTVGGISSANGPVCFNVRAPINLVLLGYGSCGPYSPSENGYTCTNFWQIEDQYSTNIPDNVPPNEAWGAGPTNLNGSTWPQATANGGGPFASATVIEDVNGYYGTLSPPPGNLSAGSSCTSPASGSEMINWQQEWFIGSSSGGQGLRAQVINDGINPTQNYDVLHYFLNCELSRTR